jgi:quercetin dioxygenase-like cupin family protein
MERTDRTREYLSTSYQTVCQSYERIDDFRAKLLGLLPLASGAGFVLVVVEADKSGVGALSSVLIPIGVLGALITVGLLFYEARGIQKCVRLISVGEDLEDAMGIPGRFRRWPDPLWTFVNEPNASGIVYSSVLAGWVFVAVSPTSIGWSTIAALVVLVGGLVAMRGFYWWVTWSEGKPIPKKPIPKNWWYRRFNRKAEPRKFDIAPIRIIPETAPIVHDTVRFDGTVRAQDMGTTQDGIHVLAVFFDAGARTRPHVHATEQVLAVVHGRGLVGIDQGGSRPVTFQVSQGDTVCIPARAWHWHGATSSSSMWHMSIRRRDELDEWEGVPLLDWEAYPSG